MKYLSLFSGIGGFELGIQKAYEEMDNRGNSKTSKLELYQHLPSTDESNGRWWGTNPTCIGFSEIDKYAIQVYNKHFKHKNYGDATKIDTRELPDFDLLVGGFPCQAFSIAGKRRGFDEARGTLFFDIARILADKKPRNFILENVKGLLSHDNGNTFTTIIRILSSMGYFVEWQVLNAKNFGVPQNRERVFIVGHLGGQPRRKVFPITDSNPKTVKYYQGDVSGKGFKSQQDRVYDIDACMGTLPSQRGQDKVNIAISNASKREFGWQEERSPCLQARDYKEPKLVLNEMRIRRLTPLECERLMAYPDNWTQEGTEGKISDTQRYKMCGNGIVSNVVKEVVKRLYQ